MVVLWLLLAVWGAEPISVEVATLDGRHLSGRLEALSADALVLERDQATLRIPVAELLEVRAAEPATPSAVADSGPMVTLQDGSRFRTTSARIQGGQLVMAHPLWGALTWPAALLRTLQFAPDEPALQSAWKQLAERPSKKDLLVIRKEDVLDHLDGVAGDIDETKANFLLDGDQISVKRERIFGIVYSRKEVPATREALRVEFAGGDVLVVRQMVFTRGQWQVHLGGGRQFTVPADSVQRLDYSQGKVQYLSALEPREVKYTPFWDYVFEYQRDRHLFGGPLRIGGRSYARGLAIHSKTQLRYRLGGEYRRFAAVVGMDPEIPFDSNRPETRAKVRLEIRGDGRLLFAADYHAGDPPQALDLSVEGVAELEILVDFGDDSDIGDRIHLGEARVVK